MGDVRSVTPSPPGTWHTPREADAMSMAKAAAGVPKSDWSLPTRPGLQIEDVSPESQRCSSLSPSLHQL